VVLRVRNVAASPPPLIDNTKLTLNLLIHVILQGSETQLRVLTVATGRIPKSDLCPWGPSATRVLIEVTTGVSSPIHRSQDAVGRLPTLIGLAYELVLGLVSGTGVVILRNVQNIKPSLF
jgi:hypothetical protein